MPEVMIMMMTNDGRGLTTLLGTVNDFYDFCDDCNGVV